MGGSCVCDAASCPNGCCNGGTSGTCEPYASQTNKCGFGGAARAACAGACDTTTGRCLVTLASGQSNPQGIAVDSTSLYWTDYSGGTVMKISLGGSGLTTLASGQSPEGIAVDSTSVYWTDVNGGDDHLVSAS